MAPALSSGCPAVVPPDLHVAPGEARNTLGKANLFMQQSLRCTGSGPSLGPQPLGIGTEFRLKTMQASSLEAHLPRTTIAVQALIMLQQAWNEPVPKWANSPWSTNSTPPTCRVHIGDLRCNRGRCRRSNCRQQPNVWMPHQATEQTAAKVTHLWGSPARAAARADGTAAVAGLRRSNSHASPSPTAGLLLLAAWARGCRNGHSSRPDSALCLQRH